MNLAVDKSIRQNCVSDIGSQKHQRYHETRYCTDNEKYGDRAHTWEAYVPSCGRSEERGGYGTWCKLCRDLGFNIIGSLRLLVKSVRSVFVPVCRQFLNFGLTFLI